MLGYMLLHQNQIKDQKVVQDTELLFTPFFENRRHKQLCLENRNCDLKVLASCYSFLLAVELIDLSVTMLAKTVH